MHPPLVLFDRFLSMSQLMLHLGNVHLGGVVGHPAGGDHRQVSGIPAGVLRPRFGQLVGDEVLLTGDFHLGGVHRHSLLGDDRDVVVALVVVGRVVVVVDVVVDGRVCDEMLQFGGLHLRSFLRNVGVVDVASGAEVGLRLGEGGEVGGFGLLDFRGVDWNFCKRAKFTLGCVTEGLSAGFSNSIQFLFVFPPNAKYIFFFVCLCKHFISVAFHQFGV